MFHSLFICNKPPSFSFILLYALLKQGKPEPSLKGISLGSFEIREARK